MRPPFALALPASLVVALAVGCGPRAATDAGATPDAVVTDAIDARASDDAPDARLSDAMDTLDAPNCAAGQSACAGACVDLARDPMHCGACEIACPADTVCRAGACTCNAGSLCGDSCTDTATDPFNCGGCGQLCPLTLRCVAGLCRCPTPLTMCPGACVDTANDDLHCGGCNQPCPAGALCRDGACAPCGATSSFARDVLPVFGAHCLGGGCHGRDDARGNLVLEPDVARTQLVGIASDGLCAPFERVVPGDSARSVLTQSLVWTGACANPMPDELPQLDAAEIDIVRRWICAGAADN